jgi:mannosyltransferase OCH1-like enzyme
LFFPEHFLSIPRIIHQTASCTSPLHPALRANVEALKAGNPGWEHRLYDDDDARACIRRLCGPDRLALFDRIHPDYGAAKADIFRYVQLYETGGVYLDIKSTARRPLSEVLAPDDAFLLSFWNNGPGSLYENWGRWPRYGVDSEYQQWHIVCVPRHPFLAAAIEQVWRNLAAYHPVRDGVGQAATVATTGPVAYTTAIRPILARHPHRVVAAADLGLVYSIFDNGALARGTAGSSGYTSSRASLLTGFGPPAVVRLRTAWSRLTSRTA